MPRERLPSPGLGTSGNDDPENCAATVADALELGYRHVDTAQMYGNEAAVGEGLRRADVAREDVVVASKVHPRNLGADDVRRTAPESRDRLGVETIDLMYVHWPTEAYDPNETLPAFDELRDEGLIRHVGVSNFSPALLDEARDVLAAPIVAHQVEMHPLLRQEELHAYAVEDDHYLVAYCPLVRGAVSDVPELVDVAEKHDATPGQVSLAWLMAKENVVPIPMTTGAHLEENWAARTLELDDEDVATIEAIREERRLIDRAGAPWHSE